MNSVYARSVASEGNSTRPDRRSVLAVGLSALAAGFPPARHSHAAISTSLRTLAAGKGLLYGTAISAAQINRDRSFVELVLQQAGLVVVENDMKWQFMNRGAPGDDDYGPADVVAGFAKENGLLLRGHNL